MINTLGKKRLLFQKRYIVAGEGAAKMQGVKVEVQKKIFPGCSKKFNSSQLPHMWYSSGKTS